MLRAATLPGGTRDGALDGLIATAEKLRQEIKADKTLDGQTLQRLEGRIDDLRRDIQGVTDQGKPDPMAKYATLKDWQREVDEIYQLDPSRHDDAWKRLIKKYDDAILMRDNDKSLSDTQRDTISDRLEEALRLISENRQKSEQLQRSDIHNNTPR